MSGQRSGDGMQRGGGFGGGGVVDLRSRAVPGFAARRRLRIAQIAPAWVPVPPPGYGGIERVVSLLTEELAARGHDVTLFAVEGSRTSARLVTTLDIPPHPDDPSAVADDIFHTLSAYLAADDFDVIHDHSGFGPAFGAMLRHGPAVVHTLHGPWTPLGRRYLGLLHDRVSLVAISRAQTAANPTVRYAGVVPNGVDVAAHPYSAEKDDYLLFVGRVSPEKGPEVAVEVAHRAGLPLVMVVKRRERAEQEYWDEVVAPRLRGSEAVIDEPPEELKLALLRRARATLFPISWPEPFGLVMAESMACGTPVIARPLGAAPEVIHHGKTGFLCETVDEMVAAVERSGEVAPEACRARVEEAFSGASMADGYELVFTRVLRDQRRRAVITTS